MPVETQQTEQPDLQQPHHNQGISRAEHSADDIEEEEDEPLIVQPRTAYDRVYDMAEKFSGTRIGQYVIERADSVLRTVEDTAKWSLPDANNSETNLERPMSWIPFLYLIVVLRIIRVVLSIAAVMIGNRPVTPQDVVYFIQTRRRKLRSIRFHGIKTIHERETETNSVQSTSNVRTMFGKLRTTFASAICRPGIHREPIRRRVYVQHDAKTEHSNDIRASTSTVTTAVRPTTKRPRDEDETIEEDANLTVDQILNKYANADSDDDSDFVANEHDTTNDDESTSSGTSEAGSGDEAEVQNNAPVKNVESNTVEDVVATNEEASNTTTTNGTNITTNITNNHNQSVELVDSKNQSAQQPHQKKIQVMPKPIIEIKKEYSTSDEQLTAQSPKENGGDTTWETDVASNITLHNDNAEVDHQRTPLHEHQNSKMVKPKIMKMGNATATAVQSIKTMSQMKTPPNESRKIRKNRTISCSSTTSTSSSSSSSCSCVKSRLIAHSISRSCMHIRSSSYSRSRSQSRSRSCTSTSSVNIDNCSDLDSFHSLDDVNMNMGDNDNLFELETTRLNASHVASETVNQTAALSIHTENIIQSESKYQQPTERTYNNSSTEDEFYSPVGSPKDTLNTPSPYKSSSTESETTPKEYEYQSVTDQSSSAEQRSYGHNNQKHTHHQNQQHQHQNRYRNRNRR